jgi:DNA-binding MarR family transcriptional regulator
MSKTKSAIQDEIHQRRPFRSQAAEVAVSILRTAVLVTRHFGQVVGAEGITIQQYNVLRILRDADEEGLPTLAIRDRMVHEAPGITRLIDKLEESGLVRRERASPDRRQVFCYITEQGLKVLSRLDGPMSDADEVVIGMLAADDQAELIRLLDAVRDGLR